MLSLICVPKVKIRHIGISNVSVDELRRALRLVPIVAVQNRYNYAHRSSEEVLPECEREGIALIVEDQLDRGAGRIVAIKKLEELDELSAAMAVPDEGMDLTGEQINPGQKAERAVALILMITREGRVNAGRGRQIWRRVCDGLDTRFFVIGDDRHRLARLLRFGGLFQDLDLAINAQNLRHLPLEFGVATLQIVPHLMRLDFLMAENLAHCALDQVGETFVTCGGCILACMACQQPRRPQLVRIAVLLCLHTRQRHQPGLGLRRNRRLLARSGPVVERCQRAIGYRPLDAALDRLMMNAKSLSHPKERGIITITKQYLRPLYPARRLASRARNGWTSPIPTP